MVDLLVTIAELERRAKGMRPGEAVLLGVTRFEPMMIDRPEFVAIVFVARCGLERCGTCAAWFTEHPGDDEGACTERMQEMPREARCKKWEAGK